ncbi:hypothetical protein [Scytonema sp. NUACC26]|uniref:hypothetical protein n=1 Tax=Scytonema sp. NUACC26 TaxID=3140176 RepID=UPI0034DC358E
MEKLIGYIIAGIIALAFMAISIATISYIAMLAWNAVIPTVFGLPSVTFSQTILLLSLVSIVSSFFRK